MGYSPNSAASLNGAAWSLTGVALIIVTVRVYARTFLAHAFGADDAVIIVSVLISTAFSSMLSAATAHGTGTPLAEIPPEKLDFAIEMNILAGVFGIIAFSVPKLSVGLLLKRVLNPKPLTKFLVVAAPIFSILWSCAIVIVTFTQCNPSTGIWRPEIRPKCISPNVLTVMGIFAGSFSAFLDIVFAVYPAIVVLGLQMPLSRKIGFCAVFSLGLIAAAATIVKSVQVPGLANHANVTQSDVELLVWTSVETNIIIIAASIPTLGPLLKKHNNSSSKTPKRSSYREFSGKGDNYSYQLRESVKKGGSRSASALAPGFEEDDEEFGAHSNEMGKFALGEDGNITKTVEVYTTTVEEVDHTTARSPVSAQEDANGGLGQGGDMGTWYNMPERQPRFMS